MRHEKNSFIINKNSQTYADTLAAIGLANLLRFVSFDAKTLIIDEGTAYRVEIEPALKLDQVLAWKPQAGYPYLKFDLKDTQVPVVGEVYDYPTQRELEAKARELGKKGRNQVEKLTDEEVRMAMPRADLKLIKTFNTMRKGSKAYNELWWAIRKSEEIPSWLAWKLGFLDKEPDFKELRNLEKITKVLQIYNPICGKGANSTKPDGAAPSSFPERLTDWFEEWLKYQAMHLAMSAFFVGSGSSDNKIFVVAPQQADLQVVHEVRDQLLKLAYSSIKLDIMAIITVINTLLAYYKTIIMENLEPWDPIPSKIIGGIHTAYFSSMGSATAITNVSFMGIPGWIPVRESKDVDAWKMILQDFEAVVKCLDEKNSGDTQILLQCRDFLATTKLETGLAFFASYGARVLQLRATNKYGHYFGTKTLEGIFMAYNLEEIIQNPGFLHIADAIRKSTVMLQERKLPGLEVRYGLAQDWKRKVAYPDEFIATLSEFAQEYNAETARAEESERVTGGRYFISPNDLDQVMGLIEKRGSKLVGMLLLAYGYARYNRRTERNEEVVKG